MHQQWQNEFRDTLPVWSTLAAALVLVALTLIGAQFFISTKPDTMPSVEAGELSVSGWDYADGPIELSGNWEFYWREFILADGGANSSPAFAVVPKFWSALEDENGQPIAEERGFASYRMVITDVAPGNYALYIPILYAPSRLWVNGSLTSENGLLARNFEDERSIWKGHYVGFDTDDSTIEIVVEISDFVHGEGRFMYPPQFGPPQTVSDYHTLFNVRDLLIQGIATVLFIFGFVLFMFRRSDTASLYFALFSLSFGTILSFIGLNMSEILLPDADFWLKLNIFYAAEIATMVFLILYVGALYPQERVKYIEYVLYALSAFAFILTTVELSQKPSPLDIPYYTWFLNLVAPAVALYTIFAVVRAAFNGRDGAIIFLIGISILVYCILGEMFVTQGNIPAIPILGLGLGMSTLGFLIFLIAQVIILAQRWTHTLQSSEKMTVDLSRLIEVTSAISSEIRLESLLQRIVHGATEFIHAERSTLYLYDERTDELWSLIAEGLENKEIRMPAHEGLAGACFQTGNTIKVDDAYADSRFNRQFDIENNFRTRNILTMAVEGKSGKRIGVMQVLNKIGRGFEPLDEERLHAFAAQAAIAIENAELFGEVIQARNYNESILGSMSNGVVTINAYGHIEKINAAALGIFGGQESDYLGTDANAWLEKDNAWLIDELAMVRGEEVPRTLLDIDVITPDGSSRSLNISIVPLVDQDGGDNGTLMLVEDISHEKRLRGTMSRFMTKEIADRILEQGEESLAGSNVNASVLFADMRNFTGISERLGARETVAMLNEFFGDMTEAIFNWQGVLDKFIGDSIMAVFGAPLEGERDADNALASAIEMMQILRRLNDRRVQRGEMAIDVSIGIATGEVIAGTIGSAKRVDYTVVGDSVNLAARLENVTRYYGAEIIVSEETIQQAKVSVRNRELDLIRVKGREQPSGIYEVLGHQTDETFPNMDDVLRHYSEGLSAYRQRNWDQAIRSFRSALTANENDRPSNIYLERSVLFKENPPPGDWDGVWVMTSK